MTATWRIAGDDPDATWVPTTAQVAAFMRARTAAPASGDYGVDNLTEGADFPDAGTGTLKSTVQAIIDSAADEAGAFVGDPCPVVLAGLAKRWTIYTVGGDVEASKYPRQSQTGETAAQWFKDRAELTWGKLMTALEMASVGDEPGPEDNAASGTIAAFYPPSRLRDCYGRRIIV